MKILIIASGDFFSTYGGGQVYVKNLVDEMIAQGLDVSVFSFVNKKNVPVINQLDYKGISIYEITQNESSLIKETIVQISPDVVHAHAQKAFISGLCNELSIPCIITAHHGGITCPAGTLMNCNDEICKVCVSQDECLPSVLRNIRAGKIFYPLLKRIPLASRLKIGRFIQKLPFIYFVTPIGMSSLHIENKQKEWREIVENVDLMIAPSDAIAENMLLNGLRKETLKVIPHGIPFPVLAKKTLPVDISGRMVKFFYVGRICYVKGIHVLLDAFSQLEATQCEMHLVGDSNGKYQQQLRHKYKMHKNIIFHGKIKPEDVSTYIEGFDILVHPAIYLEVFGLNIAEALLEGKPVIATRCGGPEMQIEEGINGLLVKPNDIEMLRDAMTWMMNHPKEISEMSEHAPDKVIPVKKHVEVLVENYYTVIANKNK